MTPRVFTLRRSQLATCPVRSLLPSHWREDGTCLCTPPPALAPICADLSSLLGEGDVIVYRDGDRGDLLAPGLVVVWNGSLTFNAYTNNGVGWDALACWTVQSQPASTNDAIAQATAHAYTEF